MRAAIVDRYGPPEVVRIAEVPRPEPGRDEVLVRVRSAAVSSGDARIRGARFPRGFGLPARLAFGISGPRRKILGGTFSGVVESVGARVEGFSPGAEVCGMTGIRMGTHAEYVVVPAARLARKLPTVSHDDAAGVLFGGTTALYFLRDRAAVRPGESVLVNGASGAVGTNAVQLAASFGAEVTGVTSPANAELVSRLGARHVIDRTTTDLTVDADIERLGPRYDVVVDTVGNLSISTGRRLLREGGRLALAVAGLGETVRARGNVLAGSSSERAVDFDTLLQLVTAGTLTVINDASYDLTDIVEAYRRVDSGRKVGNVIVHP